MAKRKPPASGEAGEPLLRTEEYQVMARRYRPQQFKDVIGQEPVTRALVNALESNRVAHAYLFTGARGVGKTSTARILAKALNCQKGPTPTPCDACEICRSIATGEDVDVLEIDGASNRGIDEVREIRQNVLYRPSRSCYKIYIIDEVHQVTPAAFNALLKTLEEPPSHVKFIFATTDVNKIPVTILSRCQRFDFAGIATARIAEQLRRAIEGEGMEADAEALELIARRAGGSMRDAQSLLDQLLASGSDPQNKKLTIDQVQHMLGMANDERVLAVTTPVIERNPQKALQIFAQAMEEGLQLGDLVDQLIDYWRDLMVVNCAGLEAKELSVSARHRETLTQQAQALSLDTILAGLDILHVTKSRLRNSGHGRVLVEMALVRLARLPDLVALSQLANWLAGGQTPSRNNAAPTSRENADSAQHSFSTPFSQGAVPTSSRTNTPTLVRPDGAEKKNLETDPEVASFNRQREVSEATLPQIWQEVLAQLGPILAKQLEKISGVAISAPKTLVLCFDARYNLQYEHCREPTFQARIEEAMRRVTGQSWNLRVESEGNGAAALPAAAAEAENSQSRYRRQRTEVMQTPLVKRAFELMGAQIVQMDESFGAAPTGPPNAEETPELEEE